MEPNEKQEMKKWSKLLLFGLIGYLIVQNISVIGKGISFFVNIISPFVIGACLAFIINIPMAFFETKLKNLKLKKERN